MSVEGYNLDTSKTIDVPLFLLNEDQKVEESRTEGSPEGKSEGAERNKSAGSTAHHPPAPKASMKLSIRPPVSKPCLFNRWKRESAKSETR
jgi:hypothetical protein